MYVKVMVMEHVIGHIAGMRSRENYVSANELFDELFGFIMNCAQEAMNNMDESTVDDVARALEIMDDTMNRPHEPSMKISGPAMTEEEIDALLAEHAKDD